jgi:hypothetical protein
MAAATLSVGVLLAILEAAPEIRVPFRGAASTTEDGQAGPAGRAALSACRPVGCRIAKPQQRRG